MMRYERVSPEECVPLSNGKKSNLKATYSKQQDGSGENGRIPIYTNGSSSNFEAKGSSRFRSPSKPQDPHHHQSSHYGGNGGGYIPSSSPQLENNHHHDTTRIQNNSPSPSHGSGDVLLQWGQKKRSRASRTFTDDSSSSSSAPTAQASSQAPKFQRRRLNLTQSLPTGSMPPPPPPPPLPPTSSAVVSSVRRRSSITTKDASSSGGLRNEERSRTANVAAGRVASRSTTNAIVGKRSTPSPEKFDQKKIPCSGRSAKHEKLNENGTKSIRESGVVTNNNNFNTPVTGIKIGGEKGIAQVFELPKISLTLSRKEKEEDFLRMKGTKLPHRPKKRPKNIDRSLQYCYPGMWLADLTRSRYEVREKKSSKKQKRRGLKGMESMESDSD